MTARRLTILCAGLVAALLAIGAGSIAVRTQRSRAVVDSLLRFDGSVFATYDDYEYTPPSPDEPFVIRGGLRIHGLSVYGDPSPTQRLLAYLFGELASAEVYCIYWDYWDGEPVTDQDLRLLAQVPELRELHVIGADITDAGIEEIVRLRRLTVLDLTATRVTKDGLRKLAACTELRELDLSRTEADEPLVQELQRALPKCWITW